MFTIVTILQMSEQPGFARGRVAEFVEDTSGSSADYIRVDGTSAPTADIDMGVNKIINLGTPTANTDLATKAYADANVGGADEFATAIGLKAKIIIQTTNDVFNSGTIVRYDGGAAMTVADTGSPSATQIGRQLMGTGVWRIIDGSGTLFDEPTDPLQKVTVSIMTNGTPLGQFRVQAVSAHVFVTTITSTSGSGANAGTTCMVVDVWA